MKGKIFPFFGISLLYFLKKELYYKMRIITKGTLQKFWTENPRAEQALKSWYAEACSAHWRTPDDVKEKYGTASIINNNRVVFNICGNKYRLVVHIVYQIGWIYIRFIGTHKAYDEIDAEEI